MGKKKQYQHWISDINPETRRAQCTVCGPCRIRQDHSYTKGWRCAGKWHQGVCEICGKKIPPARKVCEDQVCTDGVFEARFWRFAEPVEGGHMKWNGPVYDGKPHVSACINNKNKKRVAAGIAYQIRTGNAPGQGSSALPECGESWCMAPAHMGLSIGSGLNGQRGPFLSSNPLREYARLHGFLMDDMPAPNVRVSVWRVDSICIDIFGIHPCAIYGWDFFKDEDDRPQKAPPAAA